MVHHQRNGIAQNTKYEEIIKVLYLYKLELRSKNASLFKLLRLQSKNTLINILYLYKLEIRSKTNK